MKRDLRRGLWWVTLVGLAFIATACVKSPPKDLDQGARMIRSMLRPGYLRKSMFLAVYPDGRASEFVDFTFSDLGAAEWPPSEDPNMNEMEREQYRQTRVVLAPMGVAFRAATPDPEAGRQIVLTYDDEANEVIVLGYEDPTQEPVLERRFVMPQIELTPEERRMLESFAGNAQQMGANPSSSYRHPTEYENHGEE